MIFSECTHIDQPGSMYTTAETFGNAALFLRLGLPSTLFRHENGAFRKRSSNWRNLKTPALRVSVDGKYFENGAFRKRCHHGNQVIFLPEFYSNTNPKRPMIGAFSNFSGVVWRGPQSLHASSGAVSLIRNVLARVSIRP